MYPKIPHLFEFDPVTKLYAKEATDPVFGCVSMWHISEKLPGISVSVEWNGRNANAKYSFAKPNSPTFRDAGAVEALNAVFDKKKMRQVFEKDEVVLYLVLLGGEFGHTEYSKEPKIVLIDGKVPGYESDRWLEFDELAVLKLAFGLEQPPCVMNQHTGVPAGKMAEAIVLTRAKSNSPFAEALGGAVPALGWVGKGLPNFYVGREKKFQRLIWQVEAEKMPSVVEAPSQLLLPGRMH